MIYISKNYFVMVDSVPLIERPTHLSPLSCYGRTKLCGELVCKEVEKFMFQVSVIEVKTNL